MQEVRALFYAKPLVWGCDFSLLHQLYLPFSAMTMNPLQKKEYQKSKDVFPSTVPVSDQLDLSPCSESYRYI